MDSQDRDQSKSRRRDDSLARRLGEALDEMDARNADDCPDGEILAAYAEQGLGHAETGKWQSHFATCSRCRKILLVLAASADTPLAEKEVAHLGELVMEVRAPVEITGGSAVRVRPRLWDWRMRWLAPALGVAAVLVVWFVMRPPWRATDRGASPTLVAQAPKEEPAPSAAPAELDQLSRVEPLRDQKALPAPPPDRSAANAPSLGASAGVQAESQAESGNELKKTSPGGSPTGGALQRQEKLGISSEAVEVLPPNNPASLPPPPQVKAAPAAPALAPSPQARAKADAAVPPAPEVPQSTSQTVTVTEAAPQVETTNGTLAGTVQQQPPSNTPLNGRAVSAFTARPIQGFTALLRSPSGSILWRAGIGGLIERSTDAGKTWVPQSSLSKEDWLAGSAVSDTVCWVAGRNGAIARTIDGARWEHVAPPTQAAGATGKLPDVTGITARDASNVTITTGDGRRFATLDGGKTWQAQ